MATLLQGEGTLLGTLIVANRLSDLGSFDSDDLRDFDAYAAQIDRCRAEHAASAIASAAQAFHDTLTGLANRALVHGPSRARAHTPRARTVVAGGDVP